MTNKHWFAPDCEEVYSRTQKCGVCEGSMATGRPVLKALGVCPGCHYVDIKTANAWAMEDIHMGRVSVED